MVEWVGLVGFNFQFFTRLAAVFAWEALFHRILINNQIFVLISAQEINNLHLIRFSLNIV